MCLLREVELAHMMLGSKMSINMIALNCRSDLGLTVPFVASIEVSIPPYTYKTIETPKEGTEF